MIARHILLVSTLLQTITAIPLNNTNHMPKILVSDPSSQKVTKTAAFTSGAGNKDNSKTNDGIGKGTDTYNCYYGDWENFPSSDKWISFDDMWSNAQSALESSCADLGIGSSSNDGATAAGDSATQISDILAAVQSVAEASLVDHRYIFATIIQESSGCVNIKTSNNGEINPGLMQSADGSSFVGNSASASAQASSIKQMIIDGTQGTSSGAGLVQCINQYGNIYEAARCYNSGQVDPSNLNNAEGATASYVTDIANRMTGWLYADGGSSPFATKCTGGN